jgi:hypothetical protein
VAEENAIRAKRGLKRKKPIPGDDDEDYKPESTDEDNDDSEGSDGDAEEGCTEDEFDDDEFEATESDTDWTDGDKKDGKDGKHSDEDDDDDDDDESEEGEETKEKNDVDSVKARGDLTVEERKDEYLKSMKEAEEYQDRINKLEAQRRIQRVQDRKNLSLLEKWTEEWKKIRNKDYRDMKAAESDPLVRKRMKNTSIQMILNAHILSTVNSGCEFIFRKPHSDREDITATLDCATSEIILSGLRFSDMAKLYAHLQTLFTVVT